MALFLLVLPFVGALVGYALPTDRFRPAVLVATAGAHLLLSGSILAGGVAAPDGRWLWLDPPGRIVLGLVSVLFFGCAIYAYGYLHLRNERPNRVFVACVMAGGLADLDWDDVTEYAPAVIAAVTMPLTYSIASGIGLGFISYVLIKLFAGRVKDVPIAIWVLAAVFALKFFVT